MAFVHKLKKLKEPIKFKSVGFGQFFKVSVYGSLVHALRLSKLKNDIKIKKKESKRHDMRLVTLSLTSLHSHHH